MCIRDSSLSLAPSLSPSLSPSPSPPSLSQQIAERAFAVVLLLQPFHTEATCSESVRLSAFLSLFRALHPPHCRARWSPPRMQHIRTLTRPKLASACTGLRSTRPCSRPRRSLCKHWHADDVLGQLSASTLLVRPHTK
eukprot:3667090-Pleurochrysis_carterae.AAC.2